MCGNTSLRRVFPQFSRGLPKFHECFYISIGTRKTLRRKKRKKKEKNLLFLNIKIKTLFACDIITSTAHASSVFFSSFNIKLLAFYHECSSLIDFATIYSEVDSGQPRSVLLLRQWSTLTCVSKVSAKSIQTKSSTSTIGFMLKQLNYSFSISMRDS